MISCHRCIQDEILRAFYGDALHLGTTHST